MKHFTVLTVLTGLLLAPLAALHAADAPKPNIIVILVDDLGYGDLACYGAKDIRTPNLDRMAAEGMRFTSFYAQPFCGPSRAALMTGCYPMRLAEPGNVKEHFTLPHPRETLLSEILKEAGYATAQIGKWDLAGHQPDMMVHAELTPLRQGFDTQFGTPASNDFWQKTSLMRDGKIIENPINLSIASTTQRYAEETIRVIRERQEKPFFIYLCPNMPHTALNVGKEFEGKSRRGLYGDVIEELDHNIGRILDTLRTEGIEKNTLVVFTSDNGPWILQKKHGGSPGPLRGGKASTWEAGVRVPAIAWAPGRIAPGQICDRIASTLDLLPTVTTVTGGTKPQAKLDGRDLSSWLLKGPPTSADDGTFCYYLNTHLQAVRQGKWKLVLPRPQYPPWLTAGLRMPARPHVLPEDNIEIKTPLLYDLDSDLGETTDISAEHPEVVKSLLAFTEETRAKIGDYDRIGSEARFFDDGPKRPDMNSWKTERKKAPAAKAKVNANAASKSQVATTPNIVLINVDDLGYGDVGCYGATKVMTPNIDRLASEGRKFTDAHSVSAVCTPSRYALLTGEYGWRKNIWAPVFHTAGALIGKEQITVARLLQQQNYATACVGKWHLGFGDKTPDWNGELKPGPLEAGFDYYFGIPIVNSHPPFVFVENHRVVGLDPADPFVFGESAKGRIYTQDFPEKKNIQAVGGARRAHELYRDEQVGTTLTEKTVAWLKKKRDKPFFLYFAPGNIHHPFTPHPRFKGTSQCGLYGDFIHELDWMVGEVLRAVDEFGATQNTLVIFTSDNGGMLNDGGRAAWTAGHRLNGDLLGFKFGAWEGGHRVPFIAKWPGKIPAGSTSSQLIANVDLLSTLAAMLQVKLPDGSGRDSLDVLPALTGDPVKPVRDSVILQPHMRPNLALRSGPWVFIGAQGSGGFGNGLGEIAFTGQVTSDVDRQGKVRAYAPQEQLFHLESDPKQQRNVVREHPEVAARLKAQLDAFRTEAPASPAAPRAAKKSSKEK